MKKSKLPVKADWKNFRFSWGKVKELYLIAIPSAVVTAVPSTLVGILNGLLMQFSQTAVAVFGVYFKIQSFVNMPASGLIQGMRPIVSYNYGAGNKDRIKQVMRASLNVVGAIMIVGMCLFIGFGRPIMEVFSQDEAMIAMGVSALRISSASFVFSAFAIVLSGTFEAFGQGIFSLLITFLRQLVFVPLFAFGLSAAIGLEGIWLAFPAAELLGAGCAFIIGKKALFEKFLSKESKK